MKKALILHGWRANPQAIWFPYVKENLERSGYSVFVPELPGGHLPKLDEWLEIIKSYPINENWVLVGHSLGGVAILRYLQEIDFKVSQAIIVASPYNAMDFEGLDSFFDKPFDWEAIKNHAERIDLVYENEDPVVPLDHGQWFAKNLQAPLHIIDGCMHTCVNELPILLEIIK